VSRSRDEGDLAVEQTHPYDLPSRSRNEQTTIKLCILSTIGAPQ
jgi:hypothetical protein